MIFKETIPPQISTSQEYFRTELKKRDCEYKYSLNSTEFAIITILITGWIGITIGFLIVFDPSQQVKIFSVNKIPIGVSEDHFENANYALGIIAGILYALGWFCTILASSKGTLEWLHLLVNTQGAVQMGIKFMLFQGIEYIRTTYAHKFNSYY